MQVNTGIDEGNRKNLAEGLGRVLADSYTLFLKTHNYHWNVKGPQFNSLHVMFEAQYTELFQAVDLIAERIRALGFAAPGSYAQFSKLTSIPEADKLPHADGMVRALVEGNEAVIRTARELLPRAEESKDAVTADLLTQRIDHHEKTAWMLRSLLEE
ncbi:MAG: DNA starvation/stationary phase protection protein [Bdellovibrionales bacterium]|nr:DNA starvation/stationary phase protection protein [Bdellovibrionales bacterium]